MPKIPVQVCRLVVPQVLGALGISSGQLVVSVHWVVRQL